MGNLSISGVITEILEVENGVSKAGKEWQKQAFVINTEAEFNPLVCFSLFGADKIAMLANKGINQLVEVSFNVSSREFNGKYYHNLDAWKIETLGA
jgi:hypothetical protein